MNEKGIVKSEPAVSRKEFNSSNLVLVNGDLK